MEHTKEPWRTDVDSGFPGDVMAGKEIIARTTITERSNAEANARRIVVCVNACAGIPNNFLEGQNLDAKFVFMQERINAIEQQRDELQLERDNYKSVAEAHSGAFQDYIRLREQRDELLAALELCLSWIDNWSPSFTDDPEWQPDRESIDSAIAKVKP